MVAWASTPEPVSGTTIRLYEATRLIGTGTVSE
jgi:hypothetical protein